MTAAAIVACLMLSSIPTQDPAAVIGDSAAAARDKALAESAAALDAGRRDDAKRILISAADRLASAQLLMQLARLQAGERDPAAALATLERARALAPHAEEVLRAIGQVALTARRPVQATIALEPLTRMAPHVAAHHYMFGVALMQAGDMPAASDALADALQRNAEDSLTRIALGIALTNRKMFEKARDVLQPVLDREPDSPEALAALAEAEEGLGNLDAAWMHASRTLSLAPAHPTGHLVTGVVLMKRGQHRDARESLERATAANADDPKAWYQLSLACARLGDTTAAAEHLERYRQALRAMETRILELRQAGLPARSTADR